MKRSLTDDSPSIKASNRQIAKVLILMVAFDR